MVAASTGQVSGPQPAHGLGTKEPFASQPILVKQVLHPFPQRAAQPGIDGYTKSHLGSLDQVSGDISVEHLPQKVFALAIAEVHGSRQAEGEFYHPMVQYGNARLKA